MSGVKIKPSNTTLTRFSKENLNAAKQVKVDILGKNSNTETALRARDEMRARLSASRGVSLFLSIIILAVLLAVALGVSVILVGQVRTLTGMENSVQAFAAADTGTEMALYEKRSVSGQLGNGASFSALFIPAGNSGCSAPPAVNYCIKSVGIFRTTRRAIEITR